MQEAPCLVVIDEAYAEFSGHTFADYPDRFQNAIVFKTMSKFAGMAGMRVGYAIVPRSMAPHMENIVQPCHNVSLALRGDRNRFAERSRLSRWHRRADRGLAR